MSTQELDHIDERLRNDVRRLGFLLGDVIAQDQGQAALDAIEKVRALAKQARTTAPADQTSKEANWSALSVTICQARTTPHWLPLPGHLTSF